jgi:hypothetical protein
VPRPSERRAKSRLSERCVHCASRRALEKCRVARRRTHTLPASAMTSGQPCSAVAFRAAVQEAGCESPSPSHGSLPPHNCLLTNAPSHAAHPQHTGNPTAHRAAQRCSTRSRSRCDSGCSGRGAGVSYYTVCRSLSRPPFLSVAPLTTRLPALPCPTHRHETASTQVRPARAA